MPRRLKPTALKLVDGNPGKRPINGEEPKPTQVSTRAPNGLPPLARKKWHELAEELGRLGMLTVLDKPALELACLCWATAREAFEAGQMARAEKMNTAYRHWCGKFGLSPSDRAGLVVAPDDDANEFGEFGG